MEEEGGQDDRIVFPDQSYSSPAAVLDNEVTTVTNQPNTSSNITVIAVIVISVCFILIVGVIILYKKHKKSKPKSEKIDVQISLPTLGTQYELASLLSLNTVGRKSSNQSEGSNPVNDDLEKCEKSQDVFDGRVSQFIDASTIEMNKAEYFMAESQNYTLKNILDVTLDQKLGSSQSFNLKPSHAVPENSTSRPMSIAETGSSAADEMNQISIIGEVDSVSRPISRIAEELSDSSSSANEIPNNPTVQVFPPSPSYTKLRPKSENIENRPPLLPAKKKLVHASSEMMMPTLDQIPPSPTTARSDSHLAIIPPIPPKSKPFLPPKQTINKSKEDVDRLNKEILSKSSQVMNGQMSLRRQSSETPGLADTDYDFPSVPGVGEDDEYDEPCPVFLQPDHHEQLDYDDPVQKYS